MTDDTRDVIARAILHYRSDGPQQDDEEQMAWTIFEALAVAGLVIAPREPTPPNPSAIYCAEMAEARGALEYLENCLRGWASVGAVSGCPYESIRVPKRYLEKAATRARTFLDRGS